MITPDLTRFKDLAEKFNIIPVWKEITVDMDTPVSLFAKLNDNGHAFLLESIEGGERWGRYSFIGLRPFMTFGSTGTTVFLEKRGKQKEETEVADPVNYFRQIMNTFRPWEPEELPRFYGGAVGYLGYDMVRFMERLPDCPPDTAGFHDSFFMIPELVLIYDNLKQNLKITASVYLPEGSSAETAESAYRNSVKAIETVVHRIRSGISYPEPAVSRPPETTLEPEIPREDFKAMVEKAKNYIISGDIIQVVLSQRFSGTTHVPAFQLYRALRRINPSPYLYYLQMGDEVIIGSSPEILVRLTDRTIELRPIAGTRPRGATPEEDLALEKELLADPKEKAEHLMLVDLGRNDAGRVAEMGSVRVDELMVIERYSHVMHIVSGVKATLANDLDMFDVLRACFPAGTVSGAPKIRAMEIIDELEPVKRGPYAGSVGYLGFSGNMDMAITIRTLCQKGDRLYLQAGAGIVADSDPENEWNETLNKGRALMRAVQAAQEEL